MVLFSNHTFVLLLKTPPKPSAAPLLDCCQTRVTDGRALLLERFAKFAAPFANFHPGRTHYRLLHRYVDIQPRRLRDLILITFPECTVDALLQGASSFFLIHSLSPSLILFEVWTALLQSNRH